MRDRSAGVQIAEQPWIDLWDGLPSGTYVVHAREPRHGVVLDHLVVYLRGVGGEPDAEYRDAATACGIPSEACEPATRLVERCHACLAEVGRAFADARAALGIDENHPG